MYYEDSLYIDDDLEYKIVNYKKDKKDKKDKKEKNNNKNSK